MADSKIKKRLLAQVSLEFTAAFVVLLILLLAATRMFVWFGDNIVQRHKKYEQTRTAAGLGATTASQIDFYTPSKLDIFKDWIK